MRQQTGIAELDRLLGGGLIPGTLTVVLGATGIGKTQLGIHYAQTGLHQEGERGIFFDMTSRGDAQGHAAYARRLFNWELRARDENLARESALDDIWQRDTARWDALHLFRKAGKRVTLSDLSEDDRRLWKADLNRRLTDTIAFFYGNFAHGVRRCVIDGIEPVDRASDSFQFELFEYIYHQILRKEHDWVARDLLRAHFRENAERAAALAYDVSQIGCVMLCTTKETMLEDLISRPIESGDVLSNANTIILMGKVRVGMKLSRALVVAKHRGSACIEEIVPFEITEQQLVLQPVG